MIHVDSPVEQEFQRKNANALAEEEEKENKYASLKKHGIPCDGCGELFTYEQLDEVSDEFDDINHVCKDC